jgi:hypothetical protein
MALADLVSILAKHEVEFIIVGGMAPVLRGTPVNTLDLDVVYERSAPNIDRLLQALDELDATWQRLEAEASATKTRVNSLIAKRIG